jgi:flavin-dependent dehydrogenase
VDLPLRTAEGGLLAVSARRADLDAALVDRARESGVPVLEGRAVTGVRAAATGVAVDLEDGSSLTAGYVVAADGMWSPVRKLVSASGAPGRAAYLGEWQAGRQYVTGTGPEARKLWVWFEPDMVPGYAWSFPLPDGTVNFGYGVLKGANPALKGQRIDWSDRPHIAEVLGPGAEPAGPWRAWPIPARIGTAALCGLDGRVLFAGDAAGACDPMTGEGIAQALETGEAAARAIAQAGADRPDRAARRYERVIRWGMALDDRLAQKLSAVLARPGGSDRALGLVDASDWCRRNFARWMFEDYPRAALATPHRWHRRMFTRPGAYPHHPLSGWPERRGDRYRRRI